MKTRQQELIRQFEQFDFSANNDTGDEAIFGKDQRKRVDSSIDPYDRLGKVICEFYSAKDKRYFKNIGIGCIIKRNMIFTSAHVLYFNQFNQLPHNIYFKQEGKSLIPVQRYYINPKYFEEKQNKKNVGASFDYAILALDDNDIAIKKPSLKFHKNYHRNKFDMQKNDLNDIEKYPLQIIGYSKISQSSGILMKQRKDPIKGKNKLNIIGYLHSTQSGLSGSPVFIVKPNNNLELIGIHKGQKANFNYCVSLSNLKQIHEFFENQSPQHQLEKLLECYKPVYVGMTSPNQKSAIHEAKKNLQSKIQQLTCELQLSQNQVKQLLQSDKQLKQEVQQLYSRLSQRMKPKPVSITDVVNHPQYIKIKEKLQKYEREKEIKAGLTLQGSIIGKTMEKNRISERKSFISSRIIEEISEKSENSGQVFEKCKFLNPQSKQFLLDEIKNTKKLPIKKTKLIFQLDKFHMTNPHEFIDNIPNIVMFIELTNKKILAGFTQIAFNKDQLKLSSARSRFGSNKALILDLTNKVSFVNNQNIDTIIYDQNAIVWGKGQLLIKNEEPTILYSTFGSPEGVYWDGKYSLEDLLGSSKGFESIKHYSFYRIYIG